MPSKLRCFFRIPLPIHIAIEALLILILLLGSEIGQASAQTVTPLTPEEAIMTAQILIDAQVRQGHFSEWKGAIATAPTLYYDLAGKPAVYALSVTHLGEVVGYMIVDRQPRSHPILEFGRSLPPHLRYRDTLQTLVDNGEVAPDFVHPIYSGPLSYYFKLIPVKQQAAGIVRYLDLHTGREMTPSNSSSTDLASLRRQAVTPPIPEKPATPTVSKILSGISDYNQFWGTSYGYSFSCYSGCTNHGSLSVLSYWDTHGYPNLIGGNWRDDLNWIRSTAGGQCENGWTLTSVGTVGSTISAFAQQKGYNYFVSPLWYPAESTYAAYRAEIDADRPVVIHLVNTHPGFYGGNHTVAGIGYDTNGNYIIVYDNLNTLGDQVWIQYQIQYDQTWMNPVRPDTTPPSSMVNPLPVTTTQVSFEVGWNVADDSMGSGIAGYEVQYRDGVTGSWVTWQTGVSAGGYSAIYSGEPGHTYYFRSRAWDKAGNYESWPTNGFDTYTYLRKFKIYLPVIMRDYSRCNANLPTPQLELQSVDIYSDYTTYNTSISNWNVFPDELFHPAPYLPACGLNTASSRTWLYYYDQDGAYIYGACALSQASDLASGGFSLWNSNLRPSSVYLTLWDRECGFVYTSNSITLP